MRTKKMLIASLVSLSFLGLATGCSYLGEEISLQEAVKFVEENYQKTDVASIYSTGKATTTVKVTEASEDIKDVLQQLGYNVAEPVISTVDVEPVALDSVTLETLTATSDKNTEVKYYLNNGVELGISIDSTSTMAIPETELTLDMSSHTEYVYTQEGLPFTQSNKLGLSMKGEAEEELSATIVTTIEFEFPRK